MKLKQNIKIVINNRESAAIPFANYRHAQKWTKEEQAREQVKISYYGKYSWDIYYVETGNMLKIRFY